MAICPSKKCKIVDTKSTHDGFLPQISQHTSKIVDIRSIGDKFLAHF